MQVIKTYCDICHRLIEDEVFNLELKELFEICEKCSDEVLEKVKEMEKEKIDDLPF